MLFNTPLEGAAVNDRSTLYCQKLELLGCIFADDSMGLTDFIQI